MEKPTVSNIFQVVILKKDRYVLEIDLIPVREINEGPGFLDGSNSEVDGSQIESEYGGLSGWLDHYALDPNADLF